MALNPTKLKKTNHFDLPSWEYKVSEWNLPFFWREDTCAGERKQAGAKLLSSDFVIIKVHMALQKLCLIQNINLLKAMDYFLGQGVSKEWLVLQRSAAATSNILLLLWADVQYDAKWKSSYTVTVHQLKTYFHVFSVGFFFPTQQNNTKQNPKAVISKPFLEEFFIWQMYPRESIYTSQLQCL